jgi:sterol desaturase/sphingolipid hydroxylase (fatty acid hydroxylase superfamily)
MYLIIENLLISSCLFLGVTLTSFLSVLCISKCFNMKLIHPNFSVEKVRNHKSLIFKNLSKLFVTFLPIFQYLFLHKIQITPHSYLHSTFLMTSYSVFIELFYYSFHYILHNYNWLYQNIHKKHHENTDVYPIDAFYISYPDLLGVNICVLLPIYLIPLNYYEFIFIMYFYTTSGILVHSDIFVNHHKIHHKLFDCNYSMVFPIFDVIFDTCHE